MLKYFFAIVFSLFSAVVLAETAKTSPASSMTYTQAETNIVVTAASPKFMIKLESNPTTGYSWFLHEYDPELVQPVKHEFKQGDKKLIGAPGYELWTFRIMPKGFIVPQQTSIRMSYARPWEGVDNTTQVVFRISTQSK